MFLQKGKLLMFQWGEFSDQQIVGPFVVAKAFDFAEVLEAYKVKYPDEGNNHCPSAFVAHLATSSLIEDQPHAEVSFGPNGYGLDVEYMVA